MTGMTHFQNKQKSTSAEKGKIWNPVFTSLFLANAAMYISQFMSSSLIGKYVSTFGATASVVGMVSSAFAITALLLKFVSAPAIDSLNRKWILIGAMTTLMLAYTGYALSDNVQFLFAFRLLQGAAQAFSATCCLALAADSLPDGMLGQGIGVFSLAQAISQAIGPTIGLTISEKFGYRAAFTASALVMLAGVCIASRIRTSFTKTKKFRISIRNMVAGEAVLPAVIMFLLQLVYANVTSFLVIYATGVGIAQSRVGLYFTVYAVTMFFTRPLIGKLTDRFGHALVMLPSLLCFAASFWLISITDRLPMLLLSAVVAAFGYGASVPAVQSLCMKLVPKAKRGAGSCTNYIGSDLGNLAGPVIAGSIVEAGGYVSMWRWMTLPVFAACILILLFRTVIDKKPEEAEA